MAVYTAIDDPEAYFQIKLYAGDSTNHALTFDGDTDMQPNAVWIKERDAAINHYLYDSVRGVGKRLQQNVNALESDTDSTWFQSFDSDGFSIGSEDNINDTGDNYVAWCWKESATSGFDIVTATGTGSAHTIAHSLSAVPHMIISKEKSGSVNDWTVYHQGITSAPETDSLILNETNAFQDNATHWNDTAPTSSVFTVGTGSVVNRTDSTYVYYLWTGIQGFSKFGSYIGNGNADGAFVYTGFRPLWVMIKQTGEARNWLILDNKRDTGNPNSTDLLANADDAEQTNVRFDSLSNGFKLRLGSSASNKVSQNYIYAAFAEAPFVNSNGVPCNAR